VNAFALPGAASLRFLKGLGSDSILSTTAANCDPPIYPRQQIRFPRLTPCSISSIDRWYTPGRIAARNFGTQEVPETFQELLAALGNLLPAFCRAFQENLRLASFGHVPPVEFDYCRLWCGLREYDYLFRRIRLDKPVADARRKQVVGLPGINKMLRMFLADVRAAAAMRRFALTSSLIEADKGKHTTTLPWFFGWRRGAPE
jgi:hypothetical protein